MNRSPCHTPPVQGWFAHWFMGVLLGWAMVLALPAATLSSAMKLSFRQDKPFVTAAALAEEAGVAVKDLPGQNRLAVCQADRCALLDDYFVQDRVIHVSVEALSRVLHAETLFDSTRTTVRLSFPEQAAPASEGAVQVGQLAPDFRLPKLDGTWVALSDLRGRRVLINSWASW